MNKGLVNEVTARYRQLFVHSPTFNVFSPGRINLIGEHTDYNEGFVLPAAVNHGIYLSLGRSTDDKSRIVALDLEEEYVFDLTSVVPIGAGGWRNYILGVIFYLSKHNVEIKPFQAVFSGDLPKGAGMSSSAALENAFSFGLTKLFAGSIDRISLAKVGQNAEHHFVGVKCGIMDQFSSMLGERGHAMLLDCRSLIFEHVPIDLQDHQLLLINSNVLHNLANSEYNVRRMQCEEGVAIIKKKFPQVRSLRDVSLSMLTEAKPLMNAWVYRRCSYVLEENQRVLKFVTFLKDNDLPSAGALLNESQRGMKEQFEVTCPEIDFLADFANQYDGVLGTRMMGGGFGGCTINLLKRKVVQQFSEAILPAFYARFAVEAEMISFDIENGTCLI